MTASPLPPRDFHTLILHDFLLFAEVFFRLLNPGQPLKKNWHLEAIAHKLELCEKGLIKRLILTMPPRALKSQLVSVFYPAWVLCRHPNKRFICVSYSQDLANKHARDFRRVVTSDLYAKYAPRTHLCKLTDELIETSAGGFRLAASIGGSITGQGADTIIIDDPLKAEDASSSSARDFVNDWYGSTLISRLNDKGSGNIIVAMQRLHENDLVGHIETLEPWERLNFPAIAEVDETIALVNGRSHQRKVGDLLQPEREPLAILQMLQQALGFSRFQAQYQQRPVPSTGNIIRPDWIRYRPSPPPRASAEIIISVDTALKGGEQHDYTAFTIWHLQDRQSTLLDAIRMKGGLPEIIRMTVSLHDRHRPNALLIEDRGSGTSLIQELEYRHKIRATPVKYPGDKTTRLTGVAPAFERGDVIFLTNAPYLVEVLPELMGFPNTKHDDLVDSCSQYLTWVRERPRGVFEADFGFNDPF